jgi:hypothetical protein
MTVFFPVIELIDRYAIALLKFEKTQANQEELDFYAGQLSNFDTNQVMDEFAQLCNIHRKIWSLEAELKSGRESELSLADIGSRAIQIRNHNNSRIALKNLIAEKLGCRIREIKQDHLSE